MLFVSDSPNVSYLWLKAFIYCKTSSCGKQGHRLRIDFHSCSSTQTKFLSVGYKNYNWALIRVFNIVLKINIRANEKILLSRYCMLDLGLQLKPKESKLVLWHKLLSKTMLVLKGLFYFTCFF